MRLFAFFSLLLVSLSGQAQIIPAQEVLPLLQQPGVVLIDVRTLEEHQAGALPGSINIPLARIASGVEQRGLAKDQPIVLYCRSGRRSGMAEQELRARGYQQVFNAGGYDDLKGLFSPAPARTDHKPPIPKR